MSNKDIYLAIKIAFCFILLLSCLLMPGSVSKKGVLIFVYHAVNDEISGEEQLFVKPDEFYNQIKYLSDNGYTSISFNEIENYREYRKPVIITFDDGYKDNYYNAYPILKEFNFKATVFMVADFINKPGYLDESQIKEMSGIISFQSHTLTHPELDKVSDEALKKECLDSKQILESVTQKPVIAFSYPFGRYNQNVINIVASYYTYAVTAKNGIYDETNNRYQINRIIISRSFRLSDFIKKIY